VRRERVEFEDATVHGLAGLHRTDETSPGAVERG